MAISELLDQYAQTKAQLYVVLGIEADKLRLPYLLQHRKNDDFDQEVETLALQYFQLKDRLFASFGYAGQQKGFEIIDQRESRWVRLATQIRFEDKDEVGKPLVRQRPLHSRHYYKTQNYHLALLGHRDKAWWYVFSNSNKLA